MTREPQAAVLQRLLDAVNAHDVDAMVSCFAVDYLNETPAHPQRGFRGREQVRRNWTQILDGVPDLAARTPRTSVDGELVWAEWEMDGRRRDEAPFSMRGVVIFEIRREHIESARFYLEPVEHTSGDIDEHTARVAGTSGVPLPATS